MTARRNRATPEMFCSFFRISRSDFDWLVKHGLITFDRRGHLNDMEALQTLERLDWMVSHFPNFGAGERELLAEAEVKAEKFLSTARELEELVKRHVDRILSLTSRCAELAQTCNAISRGIARQRDADQEADEDSSEEPSPKWKH